MTDPSDSPSKRIAFHAALLAAVALLGMGVILRNDFVTVWDDADTIQHNPNLNPPTIDGLLAHWREPAGALYVPLTYTAWWLIAHLAGGDSLPAWPFHLASLLVHAGSAIAVLLLLRKLVRNDLAALTGAMIFAAHPVQVEAVAWASGLKDLLCGLLSVTALIQYVAWAQSGRFSRYALFVIALVAALLAKPHAVVVPVLAAAIDGIALRRTMRQIARGVAPVLPIVIAWVFLTARVQDVSLVTTQVPPMLRPLVAIDAIAFYLWKLIVPLHFAPDYGRWPGSLAAAGWLDARWILPALAIALLAIAKNRLLVLAGAFFVAALLPVLGFVTFQFQEISTVADHYLYLPMAGVALAVAALLVRAPRRVSIAICLTIALAGAVASGVQAARWRDAQSLFTHTLTVNPDSSVAHNNLAYVALDHDALLAETLARRAVELKPNNFNAMINLGTALAQQARTAEAAMVFERAAAMRPEMADAHANLAAAYGEMGRFDEARQACETALSLDPAHEQALRIKALLDRAAAGSATTRSSE